MTVVAEWFQLLVLTLDSTVRVAVPLILASLAGLFSERSGVINIALEGLMLAGAFTAAVVTYELSNPYVGSMDSLNGSMEASSTR